MNIESATSQSPVSRTWAEIRETDGTKLNKTEEEKDKKSSSMDEYIHTDEEDSSKQTGIYSVSKDEEGNPIILFDDPGQKEKAESPEDKPSEDKKEVECTINTDQVDAEIQRLKEEQLKLQQQLKQTSSDPKKEEEIKNRLKAVDNEISSKDNDAYRKQHASVTYGE